MPVEDLAPIGAPPPVCGDHGPRILLADDNADMRDYVRRLLRRTYEVEAVADGAGGAGAGTERHGPT